MCQLPVPTEAAPESSVPENVNAHGGGSETREPYTESTVGVNTYADKSSTRKPHSAAPESIVPVHVNAYAGKS